jgi:hypothetical protein
MGMPEATELVASLRAEMAAEAAYGQAVELHKSERYVEADAQCTQSLQCFPAHAGARSLQQLVRKAAAGMNAKGNGDAQLRAHAYGMAEAAFNEALALLDEKQPRMRSTCAACHHSLAIIYACMARWDAVVQQCTAALNLKVGAQYTWAHHMLRALAHHNLGIDDNPGKDVNMYQWRPDTILS